MKIMAASFALGGLGLTGCRRPEEYVLPFGKSSEGTVPGLPVYFATAMPMRNWAVPLLAETHQGRPTKLEGNPAYAPHGGSSSLFAQASVLELYDPDRATAHTHEGKIVGRGEVEALLGEAARAHFPQRAGRPGVPCRCILVPDPGAPRADAPDEVPGRHMGRVRAGDRRASCRGRPRTLWGQREARLPLCEGEADPKP